MRVPPDQIIQPVLALHLQAAFEVAWQEACAQRHALDLLPQPNHLSVALARAIQEAAENGVSSHEDLVAAALRAMPRRSG